MHKMLIQNHFHKIFVAEVEQEKYTLIKTEYLQFIRIVTSIHK